MAKVTKKLQVTIPRDLAEQCRIQPGDDVQWNASGEELRLTSTRMQRTTLTIEERLALFDASTLRRQKPQSVEPMRIADRRDGRGWTRQDLYTRGRPH